MMFSNSDLFLQTSDHYRVSRAYLLNDANELLVNGNLSISCKVSFAIVLRNKYKLLFFTLG